MGGRRWAGLGCGALLVAMLAVAYLQSQIGIEPPGPPPPPAMRTTWESSATLTERAPVAVRAVRVDVAATDDRVMAPDLNLVVLGPDGFDYSKGSAVWISIMDAATGEGTPNPAGSGHATLDGWIGSGHGFNTCQRRACSVTYLMVARLREPERNAPIPVTFSGALSAVVIGPSTFVRSSGPTPSPRLEGLALTEVAADRFDGAPAFTAAEAAASFQLTAQAPTAETHLRLHIPASALGRDRAYPFLGNALLTVSSASSSERLLAPWIEVTGPHGTIRGLAGIAIDIDWLAGCPLGLDCDVPLSVRGVFGSASTGAAASLPPGAQASVDWVLSVRLERFDGEPDAPGAGLTLTEVVP